MKKIIGVIIGISILILGIVVISLNGKTIDYKNRSIDDWYNDIKNGKEVVTVYGASYCSHCKDYYPVITKLADKYKMNLYFFEVDTLKEESSENYDKIMNSFEIKDYNGSVPFTYIMIDGDYKDFSEGFVSREYTIDFLKKNGIIKN